MKYDAPESLLILSVCLFSYGEQQQLLEVYPKIPYAI